MPAALTLDPATERAAVNILRHLEWQPDGFSLVFLFADVGPSVLLSLWLDERLILFGRPLTQREVKDHDFVRSPEAEVDRMMSLLPSISAQPSPWWLALQRHPSDEQWNRARQRFLARLNERRFLLERDLKRPLILVLPADFRSEARTIAPDIWHVRALSEEIRVAVTVDTGRASNQSETVPRVPAASGGERLDAYAEWQRMMNDGTADGAYLPTAWAACKELVAAGRLGDADELAGEAATIARVRVDRSPEVAPLRDLSISLDNVGRVARAQGDWTQAEAAYRESLALSRQLVERLGGTPEALRDLSISLENVGQVARAQGDWTQAEAAYRESLALSRQLVERLGGTPEALRDLSISLENVGRVARAQGDWTQAEAAYRESLALRRQLVERLGGTPDALDDLAVSLLNIGAAPPGDTAMHREALSIYESLAARFPSVLRYGDQLAALRGDNPDPSSNDPTAST